MTPPATPQPDETPDQLRARIAALQTQIMVMQDNEAQALKLNQAREAWRAVEVVAERKMRDEMKAIGVSTHWAYNAGKTVGAMVTELCDLVKASRADSAALQSLREERDAAWAIIATKVKECDQARAEAGRMAEHER